MGATWTQDVRRRAVRPGADCFGRAVTAVSSTGLHGCFFGLSHLMGLKSMPRQWTDLTHSKDPIDAMLYTYMCYASVYMPVCSCKLQDLVQPNLLSIAGTLGMLRCSRFSRPGYLDYTACLHLSGHSFCSLPFFAQARLVRQQPPFLVLSFFWVRSPFFPLLSL